VFLGGGVPLRSVSFDKAGTLILDDVSMSHLHPKAAEGRGKQFVFRSLVCPSEINIFESRYPTDLPPSDDMPPSRPADKFDVIHATVEEWGDRPPQFDVIRIQANL